MHHTTLIDVPALAALLASAASPIVFDCRAELGNPTAGRAAFDTGHIPGAAHLDLEQDLSSAVRRTASGRAASGRHPLPDRDTLTTTLQTHGVQQDQQVVCYDGGPGAYAARAWWLLRWLGHQNVAVLDGGLNRWVQAGNELTTQPQSLPARGGSFIARPALTTVVELPAVVDIAAGGDAYQLVDAREYGRFLGEHEPIDPAAGHIPTAWSRAFTNNLGADGCFLAGDELRSAHAVLAADRPVAHYCGSGVTACHNILAAVHAGLAEPALYPGSFSQWVSEPTRDVATGPAQ